MTLMELILKVDKLAPNDIEYDIKRSWVYSVYWQVIREIFEDSEGSKDLSEYESNAESNGAVKYLKIGTDLLVDEPYDELYVHYMMAQINLSYDETDKYNKYMILYRDAFDEFAKSYRRKHRSKGVKNFSYYGG